jgi:hypothetical protein
VGDNAHTLGDELGDKVRDADRVTRFPELCTYMPKREERDTTLPREIVTSQLSAVGTTPNLCRNTF